MLVLHKPRRLAITDLNVIETPETVELQQQPCGIGTCFLAGFVDNMLIGLLLPLLAIIEPIIGAFGLEDVDRLGSWRANW